MLNKKSPINIGIYLYENAEVLDFSGPFEVFSTANRLSHIEQQFNVFLIAEDDSHVLARGGFCVSPKYNIRNHPPLELLIVSGGVHEAEMQKVHVIDWLQQQALNVSITASVCTGAFLLAQAGILKGCKATTHWRDIQQFKQMFTTIPIVENVSWVENHRVITSAGISAGIDMSLHLLSKLSNQQLALSTAKQMEFQWNNTGFSNQALEQQHVAT
ncbi:MAG: DJ-1/PfpI family protein [Paraglaciecola sp.]|uniref:DJ-1/PfpI family protein n=1 Tax=Paraglaciecola sp. TaxID=1920173 RepID=UPI0032993A31